MNRGQNENMDKEKPLRQLNVSQLLNTGYNQHSFMNDQEEHKEEHANDIEFDLDND